MYFKTLLFLLCCNYAAMHTLKNVFHLTRACECLGRAISTLLSNPESSHYSFHCFQHIRCYMYYSIILCMHFNIPSWAIDHDMVFICQASTSCHEWQGGLTELMTNEAKTDLNNSCRNFAAVWLTITLCRKLFPCIWRNETSIQLRRKK